MITADRLRRFVFLDLEDIKNLLKDRFPNRWFLETELLGMTNGEQFVYNLKWCIKDTTEDLGITNPSERAKVFVFENPNGDLVAEVERARPHPSSQEAECRVK